MRQRGAFVLSLALLAGLAAGSWWLAELARLGDTASRKLAHEPDYFVERFTITRMDDQGVGQYKLVSSRMLHYADDNSTHLTAPVLTSIKPNQPRVTIHADTGIITDEAEQVRFIDNVVLNRAASRNTQALVVRTQELLVLPEKDIARSDRRVHITQGKSTLLADTMLLDRNWRTLQLNQGRANGRVRAVIEPKGSPGTTPSDRSGDSQ